MLRNFPRNFWAFVLWVRKNPRKIPSKFPTKFSKFPCEKSKKIHRRASAGAQGEWIPFEERCFSLVKTPWVTHTPPHTFCQADDDIWNCFLFSSSAAVALEPLPLELQFLEAPRWAYFRLPTHHGAFFCQKVTALSEASSLLGILVFRGTFRPIWPNFDFVLTNSDLFSEGFWEGGFQKVPRTPPRRVRPLRRAPYGQSFNSLQSASKTRGMMTISTIEAEFIT